MLRFLPFFVFLAVAKDASPRLLDVDEIMGLPDPVEDPLDDMRTIDQVLGAAGASAASEAAAAAEGGVLVDMDMIVRPDQLQRFFDVKGQNHKTAFAGSGLIDEKARWPKAIVPYFLENDFGEAEKNVYSAMKEWMEKTCIRFTPKGSALHREAGHNHNIRITGAGKGCSSHVGYGGYSHFVSLSLNSGCATHGTSLHELGHSLGLAHEHQRIDRDKYLKLRMDYVVESHEHNFLLDRNTTTFGMPYDYCSVMHYGPYSFSKYQLTRPTMLTKDPNYQFAIGKPNSRKRLSFYDAKIINIMYKCNAKCSTNPRCKDPCYVNHKCQCECPSKDECPKKPCRDYESQQVCGDFKKRGMCGHNDWINHWCAGTCGTCRRFTEMLGEDATATVDKNIPPVVPPTHPVVNIQGKPGPKCKEQSSCSFFASKSACAAAQMKTMCPKSCGVCSPCGDKEVFCPYFAMTGRCRSDTRYMLDTCNYSCGYCV